MTVTVGSIRLALRAANATGRTSFDAVDGCLVPILWDSLPVMDRLGTADGESKAKTADKWPRMEESGVGFISPLPLRTQL